MQFGNPSEWILYTYPYTRQFSASYLVWFHLYHCNILFILKYINPYIYITGITNTSDQTFFNLEKKTTVLAIQAFILAKLSSYCSGITFIHFFCNPQNCFRLLLQHSYNPRPFSDSLTDFPGIFFILFSHWIFPILFPYSLTKYSPYCLYIFSLSIPHTVYIFSLNTSIPYIRNISHLIFPILLTGLFI